MITALDVRRALDARDRFSVLAPLDELPGPERDAVIAALDGMPDDARIDLGRLIVNARKKAEANDAAAMAAAPARAFRYFVDNVASLEQLEEMRRALRGGSSPAEAMAAAIRMAMPAPRRRVAPRLAEQPEEPRGAVARYRPASSDLRPRKRREAAPAFGPRILGPHAPDRPYGAPVGYDASAPHPPPPWERDDD